MADTGLSYNTACTGRDEQKERSEKYKKKKKMKKGGFTQILRS